MLQWANDKIANQTVQMLRLVYALVVCAQQNQISRPSVKNAYPKKYFDNFSTKTYVVDT